MPLASNSISIVIPVLNEALNISRLLAHLNEKSAEGNISEIIVVDGHSQDNTAALVKEFSKTSSIAIQLIYSDRGRAKQMNTGARAGVGSVLYFLHADSLPPQNFDSLIISEIKKQHLAGCFKMRFDSNHWWLALVGCATRFNWNICRGGDQSLFITKALFDEIGGFDQEYIIYEDQMLTNQLYKRKQFVVIQHWIVTSARLYQKKGVWRVQYHFLMIYLKKWLGASADQIYTYYKKHI
ncbi:MAG: PGL/p-HBAD biosynthesis glycosyltransferase [Flavobacteriaceae bacterium]|nr:MAG: PGL/p-HBAD biosynthesis glycosyltransferase [Flavobacteriaceae bacterium]